MVEILAHDWWRMHMEEPAEPAYTHTHTLPVPSVPKLYCPAHGKMGSSDTPGRKDFHVEPVYLADKVFCPKCFASALERIGVHQLVDKPPATVKKW